ncbi:unnamed protein product [Ectocarpus fasciculatus]
MASQPVYYVTYVNPAGGSAGAPVLQNQGQVVHLANLPPHQHPGPSVNRGYPPAPPHPGLRTQDNDPPPPPYPGPSINTNGAGGDPRATNNKHRGGEDAPVVPIEKKTLKWVMFLVGNLISVAVVVSEIAEVNVCFDEKLSDDDDEYTTEENAENLFGWTIVSLILGLLVDVSSALILSANYRSPLDIKSAHMIPPGDMRSCVGTAMVKCVAPFSWGLVYLSGSLASIAYGDNSPCGGGVEGSVIQDYLMFSGGVMGIMAFFMIGLAFSMCLTCCSTPEANPPGVPPQGCCYNSDSWNTRVLLKGPLLDLGWQLQGTVVSYRAGAISLNAAILLAASGVVGEVLAAFGSFAPEEVQELVAPVLA